MRTRGARSAGRAEGVSPARCAGAASAVALLLVLSGCGQPAVDGGSATSARPHRESGTGSEQVIPGGSGDGRARSSGAAPDLPAGETGPRTDLEDELRGTLDEVQDGTGIRGGIVVRDESTGQEVVVDADFPVRAASTAKVVVVMARFRVASSGGPAVTATDRELMHRALAESDNEATDVLYTALGATAEQRAASLEEVYGLLGVAPGNPGAGWGEALVTARDGTAPIAALREPPAWLGSDNAQSIREDMSVTAQTLDPSQAFGVGAMAPTGTTDPAEVYLKNGWLAELDGRWSVSSIGAVTTTACDLTVSIATFGAPSYQEGMAAATAIAEPLVAECEAS